VFLRSFTLAALSVVCAGLVGCSPLTEAPQDETKNPYYKTAKERVETRDFAGAIEAFEKATQLNPNSVLAHYELALVYEQREFDYAAAIYHYNKVLKLRPSGYPSDNARVRIPVCKQELAKSQAMEAIVPTLPLQFEKLKDENDRLHRLVETQRVQIATWQSLTVALRAALASNQTFIASRWPAAAGATGGRVPAPSIASDREVASSGSPRVHTVREGDTLVSIARLYRVRLEALTTANPGVNPRRLRVGHSLTIPAP
jgi:tetratricopeptide (TPR) repeat protein